jgi:hypothetical protein
MAKTSRPALLPQCAALVACVVSFALLAPSSAFATHIWLGKSNYRLSAKGSNGYSLRLSTYENHLYHRISLTAESEEGEYVRYTVHGEPKNGKIHATFPGVGEINVTMHPTRLTELPPPKGCKLPKAVIQHGLFEGTIKLRGETGYMKLNTDRAHGLIERAKRQECQLEPAPARAQRDQDSHRVWGRTFTTLELEAGDVKAHATTGEGQDDFSAEAHEIRDGMKIVRATREVAGSDDFETNAGLTWASVSPPPPFLGTATYTGPPRSTGCPFPCAPPSGQLSGSLRVPLPGLSVVPLTGPGVMATLSLESIAY